MDGTLEQWTRAETVDIETRAIVGSLVSALGGTSIEENGRYVLGDDALACLKDIRRWIKVFDDRIHRLDVKRVLAESNLVKGDLLEILSSWAQSDKKNKLKTKISLKCVELLVALTWPIEIDDNEMKRNHHRHIPYLKLAQVEYKRAILHHDTSKVLRTAIELAVPYMLMAKSTRAAHDEGVIRLALTLFRNLALTDHPRDLPSDGNENEVSRSATIEAFHDQGVFQMVSAISSSIGEEYVVQDMQILEFLFHTLKGIDPEKLFMEEEQIIKNSVSDFKDLVQKEKAMLSGHKRFAPSRHNRFGTLVSLDSGDGIRRTVSGQEVLHSTDRAIHHLDKHKKWNKPKHRGKQDPDKEREHSDFNKSITLSPKARAHLRRFVMDFLDSSFNPLFQHCRKAIEREDERVATYHSMHYFYLTAWFLKAECSRRQSRGGKDSRRGKEKAGFVPPAEDEFGFSLVACALNQETFVLLNRYMEITKDNKEWKELNAAMTCFTQILLTVQQMSASSVEDDQEIAENIQNRIFYEESTHDRVIQLLRDYKDQGFGYLDAVTELAHVFIRLLETYSKQNADLQIRTRRRQRRKLKGADAATGVTENDLGDGADDVERVQIVSRERKFDFLRFIARFLTQASVNTFVCFTRFFRDLNKEQLKRAHRFFYRVAFKTELSLLLFRVDIIRLFNQMIEGPEGLDPEASYYAEWKDLAKQLFRRLIRRLHDRPGLAVELLFSKIPATVFYLEHGYDNVMQKVPRPPAELEVRPGMEWEQQLGVAVSVLINQGKLDALAWVKGQLKKAQDMRQSWEDEDLTDKIPGGDKPREGDETTNGVGETAPPATEEDTPRPPTIVVKADHEERRVAMFKDNKLRLLMKLCGLERLGDSDDMDAPWFVPAKLTAERLGQTVDLIGRFEFDPPAYEDGKSAEELLRSCAAAARAGDRRTGKRAAFDDESDDGVDYDVEIDLGEYGGSGPTARKYDGEAEDGKKRRLRKPKNASEDDAETDEETRTRKDVRAETLRLKKMAEKQKFKSTMYVHDSDDESDDEKDRAFFAAEDQRRMNAALSITKAVSRTERSAAREEVGDKRAASSEPISESEQLRKSRKKRKMSLPFERSSQKELVAVSSDSSVSDGEDDEILTARNVGVMTDTPNSSQVPGVSNRSATPAEKMGTEDIPMEFMEHDVDADAGSDDEAALPVHSQLKKRGGFVIESDADD